MMCPFRSGPYLIVITAISLFLPSLGLASPSTLQTTPDGRFGTPCFHVGLSIGDTEICDLSFYRLLANPERYDGRYVRLTGFLTSFVGRTVLFPDRLSFEARVSMNGILINGSIPTITEKEKLAGIWPVIIVGKFDAKCWGNTVNYSGCINKVWNVVPIKK